MAHLFGRRANSTSTPPATSLRVQASVQGKPRSFGYGQNRATATLIDYDGFSSAVAPNSSGSGGGKGGGGGGGKGQSNTSSGYVYSASVILSLGEAVSAYNTVINGNQIDFLTTPPSAVLADLQSIGITPTYGNTFSLGFYYGSSSQTADGSWAAKFPTHSLAYRFESYVIGINLSLGSAPSVPNFTFEVTWPINSDIPALGPDANPADVISDILTNPTYGVPGFPSSCIGDFTTAKNYWRALGLMVSPIVESGSAANSLISDMMKALNADFAWSSGKLNIVPYGDQSITGNGYTYTPNLTPVYSLGPDQLLTNQGTLGSGSGGGTTIVAVERVSVNSVFNNVRIEYLERNRLYNPVVLWHSDDANIAMTGRQKIADLRQNHFFCLGSAASTSVALQLHRESAEMVQYQFTVGRQFILVDVMDILALSWPPLQLVNQLVRVTEIQENSDGTLTMTTVEVPGTAHAPTYGRLVGSGIARNNNAPASPVNAPIFFEPPDLAAGGLQLWIGLSGQTPSLFGGCYVYISTDGVTYSYLGTFQGATRMGVLTSSITSVAAATSGTTVDTVNTPGVDLTESLATLAGGSAVDMRAFNTALAVNNEIISYQNATLTGANKYTLSPIGRGGLGSVIASHANGTPIMRLDGSYFTMTFRATDIGVPMYFKFLSYNQNGGGQIQLSDAGAYTYTPTGAALSSALPNLANVYANWEAGFLKIHWDEVSDFRPVTYEIRRGATWGSARFLALNAHPPYIARGDGTYWIAARTNPAPGVLAYSASPSQITVAGSLLPSNLLITVDETAAGWPGSYGSPLGIDGAGQPYKYLRIYGAGNILAEANILTVPDVLEDGGIATFTVCYYTSAQVVSAGYVSQASCYAAFDITGVAGIGNGFLTWTDVLSVPDFFGAGLAAYVTGWVEINTSQTAAGSWDGWRKFVPGVYPGWRFQFRLAVETMDANTSLDVTDFNWSVNLPLRTDHYQGLTVPATGLAITFTPDGSTTAGAFNAGPNANALPYVSVNWQATTGDTYQITGLSLSGLTITFYNSVGTAVQRTGVNVDVAGF